PCGGPGCACNRGFRSGRVEAEALFGVQAPDLAVVAVVTDAQVLPAFEEEVAASEAEHHRAVDAWRPDDRAFQDLAEVVEQRIAAVLRGLHHSAVLMPSER